MSPERITHHRNKLESLATEIEAELNETNDSERVVELDTSIGRLSRMDAMQSQQMALELRRRKQNHLLRIQGALKRIQKGSYGDCVRCKKPIPEERLEIQPDAVVCVKCADAR